MDYIAHGFWSYIFFHRIKVPALAVAFGLLPDTLSWGIYMIYGLFMGSGFGRPVLVQIPPWVFTLYGINHSIFVALFVILVVYIILRRIPVYLWAWPISIILDIPTHKKDFLPTPFLWPISDWRFPGISWVTRKFMVINYALIAISLTAIFLWKKYRNHPQ